MMVNFETIMVSDGTACSSDEEHNASLTAYYRNFGDVMTTDEVVGYIAAARKVPKAAARG
jgi:ureidoacrylate peracid hydrolase